MYKKRSNWLFFKQHHPERKIYIPKTLFEEKAVVTEAGTNLW